MKYETEQNKTEQNKNENNEKNKPNRVTIVAQFVFIHFLKSFARSQLMTILNVMSLKVNSPIDADHIFVVIKMSCDRTKRSSESRNLVCTINRDVSLLKVLYFYRFLFKSLQKILSSKSGYQLPITSLCM